MALQVQGILIDPVGSPIPYEDIRVTTEESSVSPKGAIGYVVTSSGGEYSFTLEAGTYTIEIKQDDEYTEGVTVIIGGSGTTDLPTLLRNGTYLS